MDAACAPGWHVCRESEWRARFTPGAFPGGLVSSWGADQTVRCLGSVWEAGRNANANVWTGDVCASPYSPWNDGNVLYADDGVTLLEGSGWWREWDATFTTSSLTTYLAVYCCK